jgi:ABC-type Fe3+-citrate transport system substrate-binding protein
VDVLSHTINTNNDSIKDLDKMNTAAQDTISQVVVKNQEIQKKIEDKKTDLNDLAKMFDSF